MTAHSQPAISVVICVRNGEQTILRQLQALASQVDPPAFEVVIVDNGSTDSTRSIVESWCEEGMGAATWATIVDAGQKAGIPYARNRGAHASRGKIIAYCDADDEVSPHWVRVMASKASDRMIQGRLEHVLVDGTPAPKGNARGLRRTSYLPFATTNNFAFPRKMAFEIGGFDESLPRYGAQDLEFSWRGQEAGYALEFADDAVVRYTVTPPRHGVKKEFRLAMAHIAIGVRHPVARELHALHSTSLLEACKDLLLLPIRVAFPKAGLSRSRAAKLGIQALGTFTGYLRYVVFAKPPQLPLNTDPLDDKGRNHDGA